MRKYFYSLSKSTSDNKLCTYMSAVFERLKELLGEEDEVYRIERRIEETILPIETPVFFYLDKTQTKYVGFVVKNYSVQNNVDLTESKICLDLEYSCRSVTESEFADWLAQTKWNIVEQL